MIVVKEQSVVMEYVSLLSQFLVKNFDGGGDLRLSGDWWHTLPGQANGDGGVGVASDPLIWWVQERVQDNSWNILSSSELLGKLIIISIWYLS